MPREFFVTMSTAPKVSVIVPNYNYGQFLPQCLDSIFQQSYKNIEVFVVDGASVDNSIEVIETYAQKYSSLHYLSEKDAGPADAINKGFRHTTGAFLTWLNSDDALDRHAIERVMVEFERNRNLSLVYGSVLNVTNHGAIIGLNKGLKLKAEDLSVFDFVPQTGAVFKRYEDLLLNKDLEWGFDWELWIELSKRGEIRNIDHIVGYCMVTGHGARKSDMIIPRRTLELAGIAWRHSAEFESRVFLSYLAAILGYCFMPLGRLDKNYHKRIVRWVGLLHRIVEGKTEKGIML